jgi:hypothetical protein
MYQGSQLMLIVVVLEFPSADAARSTLNREMVSAQLEDESAAVEEESGLGDTAYWGTTEQGRIYVVLRGARVLGVMVGGAGVGDAAQTRPALRKATAAALGRL